MHGALRGTIWFVALIAIVGDAEEDEIGKQAEVIALSFEAH